MATMIPAIQLTEQAVGVILKELVGRAIRIIRAERFDFDREVKETPGKTDDLVTSADKAAQAVYVKLLQECFPGFGIIGEEADPSSGDKTPLRIPCTIPGVDAYFTIDPLDGTKAFGRRQSHGIGTMIALVVDGSVVAAYVGDVMAREIYGYRPGSEKVHRISLDEHAEELVAQEVDLKQSTILLASDPRRASAAIRLLTDPEAGLFEKIIVGGGSIGCTLARLWKGEVAAVQMEGWADTPRDLSPLIGICRKMGFWFLQPTEQNPLRWEPARVEPAAETHTRGYDLLVIHKDNLHQLTQWEARFAH